jgi:hypothetical protein
MTRCYGEDEEPVNPIRFNPALILLHEEPDIPGPIIGEPVGLGSEVV